MLKRLVKEATNGFSSSGEQNSKRKKTPRKQRDATSDDEEDDARGASKKNKEKERSSRKDADDTTDQDDSKQWQRREDTPTEDESARRGKAKADAARRKKAGRMKREPLLELQVVETVHSAMHGKKKKHVRQQLLDLFASYDTDDTGVVDAEKFKKCLVKIGVKIKRREDVEALVRCFTKSEGSNNDEESTTEPTSKTRMKAKASALVDYMAFVDFACNVRDSEKLSAIAEKLRETIRVYDDKHGRTTSVPYNVASDLKKLDKNKRGWIASDRFADFMQDHERPTFRLTVKEVATLTERFEYEYDKGTLGFDYQQFAQWLQPMLHLDKKQLHARMKRLVVAAQDASGWELGEVFDAMDDNGDGLVSGAELRQALLNMGLPLTDAQIQCLVEEYDVNSDGQIQYEEFVSLFQAPVRKKKPEKSKQQESGDSESERTAKRRAKAKANVRNTFSWAINKAFARKHAAQAGKQQSPSKGKRRASSGDSSEEEKQASKKVMKKKPAREAESSSATEDAPTRPSKARLKAKKTPRSSSEDEQSSELDRGKKRPQASREKSRKESAARRKSKDASTESESENVRPSPRRKRAESTKAKKRRDVVGDDSTDNGNKQRQARKTVKKRDEEDSSEVPKRDHRSLSAVSRHSRKESMTRSKSKRRESASRVSPRRRSVQRSSSSRPAARRQSSTTRTKTVKQRRRGRDSSSGMDDSELSGGDSGSGLDLTQVRDLQRQPRKKSLHKSRSGNQHTSGDEEDDEDEAESDVDGESEDQGSKSDREYEKHLKKALRRAFDFFDLDHSDTIEKRELVHVLRALGHEFSSKELDREMRRVDLDRNGALDFHEFVQFVKRQLSQKAYLLSKQREMEIRQAFQLQDTDKNGYLDEKEFEYLIYKVLQVELSVEEQDALLDFVDTNGDGVINEDEFIAFMKAMEGFHKQGAISKKKQRKMLDCLDVVSKLACSAMKKLVRGAPIDLDKNLLMFFGIPSNFRPALTSAAVCRTLQENSMEHALSFPCPETIVALAQDPTRIGIKKDSSMLGLVRTSGDADEEEAKELLQQAESWQAHAIVSLKRATGIPKPYDTREDDVVKRCVHVCMYQEHDDTDGVKRRRHQGPITKRAQHAASEGSIVGNVLEIPVYWNPVEEDVWEFSRKTTKEDKYKFLVRTNNVNDRLFLLVEYVVHLRITNDHATKSRRRKTTAASSEVREMAACWCKIPLRTLLAKRLEVYRTQEKLWGGTVQAPIDIEQDEILRRRTGWRAITNAFKKPTPPAMGIKSAPIESYPEEVRGFVRKMPPLIIAPFVSLPIVAEYMVAMQGSLWLKAHTSSATLCEPVLKLLPQIIDDHEALSVFRRAFDVEMNGLSAPEDRQLKFQDLVLRMWPSFLELLDRIPSTLLENAQAIGNSTRRLSLLSPSIPTAPASGTTNERPAEHQARSSLLQCTAQGKLRLRDVPVAAAPFHVREVTFDRLI